MTGVVPGHDEVLSVLSGVLDPELPVSIVDLGMVRSITFERNGPGSVQVSLVSTFLGCPAQMFIEDDVTSALASNGVASPSVVWETMPEWSPEDVTDKGRQDLAAIGVITPSERMCCPYCASERISMLAPVGATLCRRLAHCEDCGSSVEILRGPRDHWSSSVPLALSVRGTARNVGRTR